MSGRADGKASAGPLIRRWRELRRLSQMELALDAGFSPRHMSFIETGRSRPSREAVLAIAEVLEVPLRERNAMLEAAGHARAYRDAPLTADEQAHLRGLVGGILARQGPFFAVAIDHRWDVLMANAPAEATLRAYVDEGGVPGPRNLLRLTLHPEGLRGAIENLERVGPRLLRTLRAEAALRPGDDALARLVAELEGYGTFPASGPAGDDAVPLVLRTPAGTVRLLTLVMDFANPLDPAMDEIRVETFLPADDESARILEAGAGP